MKSKAFIKKIIDNPSLLNAIIDDKEVYRDWETDRKSTRLNSSH